MLPYIQYTLSDCECQISLPLVLSHEPINPLTTLLLNISANVPCGISEPKYSCPVSRSISFHFAGAFVCIIKSTGLSYEST